MNNKMRIVIILTSIFIAAEAFLSFTSADAFSSAGNLKLLDNLDNKVVLKSRSSTPMLVFYTDPDKQNINRPIMNYLLKNNSIVKKINIVTIANCNVSWIPYEIVKQRYLKMSKISIGKFYYDRTGDVQRIWKIPNCNNSGMVLIIGKDGNIKFIKNIRWANESKAAIPKVINLLKKEINS